jgi:hypothetical protein
MALSA